MLKAYQSEKYQFFVNKLKKNRGLSDAEVSSIAQGQLFTGSEAKDLKLIDEIGGLYDAVDDVSWPLKSVVSLKLFITDRNLREL